MEIPTTMMVVHLPVSSKMALPVKFQLISAFAPNVQAKPTNLLTKQIVCSVSTTTVQLATSQATAPHATPLSIAT